MGHVRFDGVGFPSHTKIPNTKILQELGHKPPQLQHKIQVQQTRWKHEATMTPIHVTPSTMQDPAHLSLNYIKTTQPQRSNIQQQHGPFDPTKL